MEGPKFTEEQIIGKIFRRHMHTSMPASFEYCWISADLVRDSASHSSRCIPTI